MDLLLRKEQVETRRELERLQKEVEDLRREIASLRIWLRAMPKFLTRSDSVDITGRWTFNRDVTVGNSSTRLGLVTIWGEAGRDVLDLRVSSSGVGTRLEVLEHNLSALPYKAPLIKMTGEDGGIFGLLGGGMFLVDVGGLDVVYLYFTDATGTNIGYLKYTPSLDKLEILGFASVAFGNFPVSLYEISVSSYVDSPLKPKADNSYDLGYYHPLPLLQRFWRNLYLRGNAEVDGWAYIDSLRVDEELNLDQVDMPATSVSGLSAVIPITVAGVTKYLAVYDSYA